VLPNNPNVALVIRRLAIFVWIGCCGSLLLMIGCSDWLDRSPEPGAFVESHFPKEAEWATEVTCIECHKAVVDQFASSHHAHANRLIDLTRDGLGFPAESIQHGEETWHFLREGKDLFIEVDGPGSRSRRYEVAGVIGHDPLWQYLLKFPNGRYQTAELSFDPVKREWFAVFGEDIREPGEWGHFSGQGMNWNANCAACHMTEYRKNYDPVTDSYASTWVAQTVSCAQCHGDMKAHAIAARKAGDDYTLSTTEFTLEQHIDNCAMCHSRRGQLTDDAFQPGDTFHDHFRLALPDGTDLYHEDGQVNNENYVYSSLLMSRMGHAGVTCMDCHNAHTGRTLLPATNNALCLRCHQDGEDGATIIDPLSHSFHAADNAGSQCVSCHMPSNVFMDRDWRRDHIFSSPDPYLTIELGIPNACNACHTEESAEWAKEWTDQWYGPDMNEEDRARAIEIGKYREGDPESWRPLLELAQNEEIDAWRAALTGMLGVFAGRPEVMRYLVAAVEDAYPPVRSAAIRGLAAVPQSEELLTAALADKSRLVRITAGLELSGRVSLPASVEAELEAYFLSQADSAIGSFQEAEFHFRASRVEAAMAATRRALRFDKANGEIWLEAAIMADRAGQTNQALEWIGEARRQAPDNPRIPYSLGLLYGSQQDYGAAIDAFEQSLALDPDQPRTLYNLALALTKVGRWAEADQRMAHALRLEPGNRDFLQVKRIIERNLAR